MQSKDKASLNVKCYKRLYHTILWQRDGNSCCFFSHSVQKDKRTCTHFPNHLLGQKWWHIPSPHPATPPSPFGRPCWTTLKLCLDIPLMREAFPHQSLVIYYSTHHETQSFFLLAMVHGTWDLISGTRDQTCNPCTGHTESKLLDHQGRLSTLTEVALSSFSLFILS